MMTLRLACAAATGERNAASKRSTAYFRLSPKGLAILINRSTPHPRFSRLRQTERLMVHGSEWEENSARHPHTPGNLHGYQKKEDAKGAICKRLKRRAGRGLVSEARRVPLGARGEPEWELLVHTRQFSERVRKRLIAKEL